MRREKSGKGLRRQLVIALICTLVNVGGILLANRFQLPFWLDTLGICLAAYYTTTPLTLASVLATDLLMALKTPQFLVYIPSSLIVGAAIRLAVRRGYTRTLRGSMVSSFGVGVLSILAYTPVDLVLNDGLSMNIWGNALYDMLDFYGAPRVICVLAGEAIVNIVDKQLCIFLAYLSGFLLWKFGVKRRQTLAAGLAAVVLTVVALPVLPRPVQAEALPALTRPAQAAAQPVNALFDFVPTIYDNTNGLPAAAMTMVAHTPDGSIWVGGYAGLCRGDGSGFTYITEGRIANVTALLTDRQGKLWIGTNDQGLALWENERFRFISRKNGLPDNSVRTIFQAEDGSVYVGTADRLCRITEDGDQVTPLDCEVRGVWDMAENDNGLMACVDYSGRLTLLQDDAVLGSWEAGRDQGRYSCVLVDGKDFLVATTGDHLFRMTFHGHEQPHWQRLDMGELQKVSRMKWDSRGNLWICAYNGVGCVTPEGERIMLHYPGFDSAIENVVEDYQGNYWLTSAHSGLMKLSRSPFSDVYAYLGLEPQTVNAAAIYRQTLYCGTDAGLTAVNSQGLVIRNALTEAVGDKRVRCLLADSRDRLWVCTYGGGLLCWAGHGQPQRWTREEGAAGDYVRCLLELPDGTMAVGGSEGLTFVQNGRVVNTITAENGLQMTQILTLALGEDGTIYAGSDGSGIYLIREGRVVDILDQSDGLSSPIVLRLVPYREGFFAVTSNALNFLEGNEARVLDKFPYFNNFDVVFHGDKAWVLASCGLFRVDPEELLAQDDQPLSYELFNHRNGFRGSLTANAWTCVDTQNRLYLCSNLGVQRIDLDQTHRLGDSYKLAIRSVTADGSPVLPEDGTYRIGAGVDSIEVRAAVYNYELEDLRLRFYLEGLDQAPAIFRQSELAPISYHHIPHGSYNLRLQLLDEEGGLLQELACPVVKEARMWEYTYFHIYLLVVSVWMVIFATWVVITVYQTARRKRELEVMSRQLAQQVEEQTSQILVQSRRMTDMQQHTIEGMATLIESRDGSTGAHVRNTGVYARMLAEELRRRGMYPEEIDEAYVDRISRVAPLHDVGKIKVSDLILNKPGRLTSEEYEIMKTHAAAGGEIIGQIMSRDMEPETLQMARDITTCHHERWDGRGYPLGRKGTEIPLCARIMAVADVFDALSSKRVYKQAMDLETAMAELQANAGTQFQAELVAVFADLLPQIRAYLAGGTKPET